MASLRSHKVFVVPMRLLNLKAYALDALELLSWQVDYKSTER